MKRLVPILAALLLLQACHGAPGPAPAQPLATVHLPAVPGRPASGYFELRVEGDRGALVSVTSPQAGRIEMHQTINMANVTSMRTIARIPVHDGDILRFVAGGCHLMIYELAPSLTPGGRIELVLHFERGDPVSLSAALVGAGQEQ
jgi:copper(I)-binding protein